MEGVKRAVGAWGRLGNIPHIPGVAEPAEPRAHYTITTKYMDWLPPRPRSHTINSWEWRQQEEEEEEEGRMG